MNLSRSKHEGERIKKIYSTVALDNEVWTKSGAWSFNHR